MFSLTSDCRDGTTTALGDWWLSRHVENTKALETCKFRGPFLCLLHHELLRLGHVRDVIVGDVERQPERDR